MTKHAFLLRAYNGLVYDFSLQIFFSISINVISLFLKIFSDLMTPFS